MKKKKVETNFHKQNYELIKKYSKESTINYKNFSQEILTSIFNKITNIHKGNEFFILLFSNIRQIEFIIFTNEGHSTVSTDIFKAIQNNETESVKFFIENCFYSIHDVDEKGKSILSYCLESNHNEIYNYLFSKQTTNDFLPIQEKPKDYEPNIFKACEEGKLTSVQWLIEKEKVNKNKKDEFGYTPLKYACEYGHLSIAQYLLSKGANIKIKDLNGNSLIHFASKGGLLSIVQYLIEKQNVDKDIKGFIDRTPLHYGCLGGHIPIVEYLISKGANIETKDDDGTSLIHFASMGGILSVVQNLIEKLTVDINIKDNYEKTPLHYACENGHLQNVEYLYSKGADMEANDYDGRTPLHYACQGHLPIVEYLLSKGANIEAKDDQEDTPLHYAIMYGDIDVIKYLLSKGAHKNATTLDLVPSWNDEIKNILK